MSKKIILIAIMFLIIGVFIGLLIQTNQRSSKPTPIIAPIKIGAIIPLTGQAANFGVSSKVGLEIALAEINQAGGLNKHRPIELIYEDSRGEAKHGVDVINKLINQDQVKFIIGPVMSSVTLATAPIAENNQVIMMTTASSPDITQAGDYIFRNREKTHQQSAKLADFIFHQLEVKQVACLYISDSTGVGHYSTFSEIFPRLGGQILVTENYQPETNDFRDHLLKIKNSGIAVIYLAAHQKDGGLVIKQIKELDINAQIIATSGIEGQDVLDIAGRAAESLIYSTPAGDPNVEVVHKFYQTMEAIDPQLSKVMGALMYDALKIVIQAMQQCEDPLDTDCVKFKLYQTQDYYGASGQASFDENGDATKTIILKTVKDGQFVEYEAQK